MNYKSFNLWCLNSSLSGLKHKQYRLFSVGKSSTGNIAVHVCVCGCVSVKVIVLFGNLFHAIFVWLFQCIHVLVAHQAYYIITPGGLDRVCQPDNMKWRKQLLPESGSPKIH